MSDLLTPPSSQSYADDPVEECDVEAVPVSHSHGPETQQQQQQQPHFSSDDDNAGSSKALKTKRKPKLQYRPANGTILELQSYDHTRCISEQDDLVDNEDVSFLHYAIKHSKRMCVVTGAGISVASGIPDFRSSNGLFQGLKSATSAGSNGKALFDSSVYNDGESTAKFHAMVNTLHEMTSMSKPTEFHRMMDHVSEDGRLLRHYTQNIDCLENQLEHLKTTVPVKSKPPYPPTIQLHGTIRHMYCAKCRWNSELEPQLFQGSEPPACPECLELDDIRRVNGKRSTGVGCLRPRIVLYNEFHPDGENIGNISHSDLRSKPDCLIIAGTSLKIPGVRRLCKELAKAVHASNGCVIWINRDQPSVSVVDYLEFIDLIVMGDCENVPKVVANYDSYSKTAQCKRWINRKRRERRSNDGKSQVIDLGKTTRVVKPRSEKAKYESTLIQMSLDRICCNVNNSVSSSNIN